ncbi:MAG: hypothetical protein ACRCXB_11705 [Aeromonadaceae bacterium]
MAKAAEKRGRPVPQVVVRAPTIPVADMFWWNAYLDLSCERETTYTMTKMGVVPIPGRIRPVAMMEYADRFGVPYHNLRYVVDALDKARQ